MFIWNCLEKLLEGLKSTDVFPNSSTEFISASLEISKALLIFSKYTLNNKFQLCSFLSKIFRTALLKAPTVCTVLIHSRKNKVVPSNSQKFWTMCILLPHSMEQVHVGASSYLKVTLTLFCTILIAHLIYPSDDVLSQTTLAVALLLVMKRQYCLMDVNDFPQVSSSTPVCHCIWYILRNFLLCNNKIHIMKIGIDLNCLIIWCYPGWQMVLMWYSLHPSMSINFLLSHL